DSGGSVKKLKTGFDQPEETEPRTLMSPAEPQISISSEPTANELDPDTDLDMPQAPEPPPAKALEPVQFQNNLN
ncbi:MAG: hypothetical protein PHW69_09880, partial [Elusimicrobiaceae bacterium]|nr:hypothetical protein [Elusimicrobiaceae bacterium]